MEWTYLGELRRLAPKRSQDGGHNRHDTGHILTHLLHLQAELTRHRRHSTPRGHTCQAQGSGDRDGTHTPDSDSEHLRRRFDIYRSMLRRGWHGATYRVDLAVQDLDLPLNDGCGTEGRTGKMSETPQSHTVAGAWTEDVSVSHGYANAQEEGRVHVDRECTQKDTYLSSLLYLSFWLLKPARDTSDPAVSACSHEREIETGRPRQASARKPKGGGAAREPHTAARGDRKSVV